MRILVIHERYREAGGEDAVVDAEVALLQRFGHVVTRLTWENASIPSKLSMRQRVRLVKDAIWSDESASRIRRAARNAAAEVVHFHNTFPLVSPSAYSACRAEGLAVVQTLHNYRLLCPNGLFFRDGRPCEDCLGRRVPWPGVMHACYRHSRKETAVAAAMLAVHNARGTWSRDVDVFVALTNFARDKFLTAGYPPDHVVVKPNFITRDPGLARGPGAYFLFVGRLADYKGVNTILRAWAEPGITTELRIAGDGPLANAVQTATASNRRIRYLGPVSHESVIDQLRGALALILPSDCYENFPLTLVEAFACGRPVICAGHGAMLELVDDMRLGLIFNAGDPIDLAAKVAWAEAHPEQLRAFGVWARAEYESKYTAERAYDELTEMYRLARQLRALN